MDIELGATYKDIVTGFVGVATGHVVYLTGCNQTLLVAKATKDGIVNTMWIDNDRLVQVGKKTVILNRQDNGFDVSPFPSPSGRKNL